MEETLPSTDSLQERNNYPTSERKPRSISVIRKYVLYVCVTHQSVHQINGVWVVNLIGGGVLLDKDTVDWIKASNNVFYAWHYYSYPSTPEIAVENALAIQKDWNVPSFNTEFGSCEAWNDCVAANISHTYWHYSSYCTTGPSFGNRKVPDDTFGGCLLGWAGADSSKTC